MKEIKSSHKIVRKFNRLIKNSNSVNISTNTITITYYSPRRESAILSNLRIAKSLSSILTM